MKNPENPKSTLEAIKNAFLNDKTAIVATLILVLFGGIEITKMWENHNQQEIKEKTSIELEKTGNYLTLGNDANLSSEQADSIFRINKILRNMKIKGEVIIAYESLILTLNPEVNEKKSLELISQIQGLGYPTQSTRQSQETKTYTVIFPKFKPSKIFKVKN